MPFYPLATQKIKIFKNWKKTPRDIIILHKCTENHDHILYCSLDMTCNELFFILAYFLPFYLPNSLKNHNLEKVKKTLEISSFYNSVPKIMIICYTVPEIWCVTDVIIFHFGSFFALFIPLTAQKIKILKTWKKSLEISLFYICVPKIIIRWCTVPEIWCMTDVIVIYYFWLFFALLPSY